VEGRATLREGGAVPIDQGALLAPLEGALKAMTWSVILVAAALAVATLT
jgi:hypothetical protein